MACTSTELVHFLSKIPERS
uniref:Uncharacterized protein n=1 Tax=Arundo donax TaxID=35708 RepID=A0A0A9H967_ARUDO